MKTTFSSFLRALVICMLLLGSLPAAGLANPADPPPPDPAERLYGHPQVLPNPKSFPNIAEQEPASTPDIQALAPTGWAMKMVYLNWVDSDNRWEIYTFDPATDLDKRLTKDKYDEDHPRANPGFTRIAYASNKPGAYEIYVMNADGSGAVSLTHGLGESFYPSWSPDGSRIVFESDWTGNSEIYLMQATGGGIVRLTDHPGYDGHPSWSPDGKQITFISNRNGGYRVFTMNADGSNPVQRSTFEYSSYPYWSPDGTKIVFSADVDLDGWLEIGLLETDTWTQRFIFEPGVGQDAMITGWDPDGRTATLSELVWYYWEGNWYLVGVKAKRLYYYSTNHTAQAAEILSSDTLLDLVTVKTDVQAPTASIAPLPDESPSSFIVKWQGEDFGAAGLQYFDVQLRVDGGEWKDWYYHIESYPTGQALYTGTGGQVVDFRVRAIDRCYNYLPWPEQPMATTRIESRPPYLSTEPLPAFSQNVEVLLSWQGFDPGGSGVHHYELQYREEGAAGWTNWIATTEKQTAVFDKGAAGKTYQFRIRGMDNALNISDWLEPPDWKITLYEWSLTSRIFDNTGSPLAGARAAIQDGGLLDGLSDRDGTARSYGAGRERYPAVWEKAGYGLIAATGFSSETSGQISVHLPPADNLILDSGFEAQDSLAAGPWIPGSWPISATLTSTLHHTGEQSLLLGNSPLFSSAFMLTPPELPSYWIKTGFDDSGRLHTLFQRDNLTMYASYFNGNWSEQEVVPGLDTSDFVPEIAVAPDGTVHVLWTVEGDLYHRLRRPDGSWSEEKVVYNGLASAGWRMGIAWRDDQDRIRAAGICWLGAVQSLCHTLLNGDGSWTTTAALDLQTADTIYFQAISADPAGNLHIIINRNFSYTRIHPDGTAEPLVNLADQIDLHTYEDILTKVILRGDTAGLAHLAWIPYPENTEIGPSLFYARQKTDGSWTPSEEVSPNVMEADMAIDSGGRAHLLWSRGYREYGLFYAYRIGTGTWEREEIIPSNIGTRPAQFQIELDEAGYPHILYYRTLKYADAESSTGVFYQHKGSDGTWRETFVVDPLTFADIDEMTVITIGPDGQVHLFWKPLSTGKIMHRASNHAWEETLIRVSQPVNIPAEMTHPVFSTVLQMNHALESDANRLQVLVDDGNSETVAAEIAAAPAGWNYLWADLADWRGQAVTLTLQLRQAAGEPVVQAVLDEVTLGSGYSDLTVEMSALPGAAMPGEPVNLLLDAANQSGLPAPGAAVTITLPAGLRFVSASVPVTEVTGGLRIELGDLPGKSESGPISLALQVADSASPGSWLSAFAEIDSLEKELETANNEARVDVHVASVRYLPVILLR